MLTYLKSIQFFMVIISPLCLIACATSDVNFKSSLENQRCELALEQIPHEQFGLKLASQTQKFAGTVFSYVTTAGGYTTQIVLDTGKATGFFLGCTLISLPFGQYMGGEILKSCLKSAFKDYRMSTLGQDTFNKTSGFRCSNLNGLSDSILKVSDCYISRKTEEANQMALKYLKSIQQSDEFYNCLPEQKRNLILIKIQNFEKINRE